MSDAWNRDNNHHALQEKMSGVNFQKLLVDSSESLLHCGTKVEDGLRRVLNIADECSPELALVTADALTKITRDVGAAPIFFAETTEATGEEMRSIVEVLAVVLKKAQPYEARKDADIQKAVEVTDKACKKHNLPDGARELFRLLVKEMGQVFMELRVVLRRHKDLPTRRLYHAVQNYMRRVKQAILCFAYNSMKLRVCIRSIGRCGATSSIDKDSLAIVVKNIYFLSRQTRTMAVLAPYHHDNIKQALKLAKKRTQEES